MDQHTEESLSILQKREEEEREKDHRIAEGQVGQHSKRKRDGYQSEPHERDNKRKSKSWEYYANRRIKLASKKSPNYFKNREAFAKTQEDED